MSDELERLRRENAELREALGMSPSQETALTIGRALKVRPCVARMLQQMYAARGRWVAIPQLLLTVDPEDRSTDPVNLLSVVMWQARKALGGKWTIECRDGAYRLSEDSVQKITDLLDRNRAAA